MSARASDATALAGISIEVWLGTYLLQGVNAVFAEFALSEFTLSKFAAVPEDPNEHVIVSENEDGLAGFIRISHGKSAPVAGCSTMEISNRYVQPGHHRGGLGRALLEQGMNYALEAGAPSA